MKDEVAIALYICALRLQNLDQLDTARLTAYVERINKPKLSRTLPFIIQVIEEELAEYISLGQVSFQ